MTDLITCADCGEAKPRDQFIGRSRGKDYVRSYCRSCKTARVSSARRRRGDAYEVSRAREAGLTMAEYAEAQQRDCDVCGDMATDGHPNVPLGINRTYVGTVCVKHARAIGQFANDPAQLRRAAALLD